MSTKDQHLVCTNNISTFYGVDDDVVRELVKALGIKPVKERAYAKGYQYLYAVKDLEEKGFAAAVVARKERIATERRQRAIEQTKPKGEVAKLRDEVAALRRELEGRMGGPGARFGARR